MCRLLGVLLAAALLATGAAAAGPEGIAFAAQDVDERTAESRRSSVTLHYEHGGLKLAGVSARLYRVAGPLLPHTLEGAFAHYSVKLDGLKEAGEWSTAARTLAGYAAADQLAADAQAVSGDAGTAAFSALEDGLYLVVSSSVETGGSTYSFAPFFIILPGHDTAGAPLYAVDSMPKASKSTPYNPPDHPSDGGGGHTPGGGGGSRRFKAVKRWQDEGQEAVRPQSVTVEILKDGQVVQTQELNEANGWSYSWSTSDRSGSWEVVEKDVAPGYTVTVGGDAVNFIVTNTAAEQPQPQPPMIRLPQTGQLWWPVPLLAGAGLALLALGWRLLRRGGSDGQ